MINCKQIPLKERILRLANSPPSGSTRFSPDGGRQPRYKDWRESQLERAYDAVVKQSISIRRAAEQFDVPRSTLHDRVSGRVTHGSSSGPPKYLSSEEEEELCQFLRSCVEIGFAKTRKQVICLVQQVVNKKGLKVKVSSGWWESFLRRHKEFSLRSAERLSHARMLASIPDVLDNYFDLLEDTLVKNDLLHKPCMIFNVDETGMPLDPPSLKIVAPRGIKHSQMASSGDKSQITVVGCCSAAGIAIPPMVVFDRKRLRPEYTEGEVPGTVYGLSKSGWIDSELFELWFRNHFLAHTPPTRPLLLLLDGHSSHYQPGFVRAAAEEKIIVFCLPPHTSHLTQPLDKGCFGPLKIFWREECLQFMTSHPDQVVTRFNFSRLFSKAWTKAMTMSNILAGFRVTGVYPFDRSVLRQKPQRTFAQNVGLEYIPLLTPRPLKDSPHTPRFTDAEFFRFQNCWDEGFDLPDKRYKLWKKMYHPEVLHEPATLCTSPLLREKLRLSSDEFSGNESSVNSPAPDCAEGAVLLRKQTTLSRFLSVPDLRVKKTHQPKSSTRVLTSLENLQLIEEKEKQKREKETLKKERLRKREEKRQLKHQDGKVRNTKGVKSKSLAGPVKDMCSSAISVHGTEIDQSSVVYTNSCFTGLQRTGMVDDNEVGLLPWISSLGLTKQDEQILLAGGWLSANHISAVQKLLRKTYPTQEGLNDTSILAERLFWPSKPDRFVQIIHVSGSHWACLSNQFCSLGAVDLYDSLHTYPAQNEGILKQACAILKSEMSSVTINVINVQYQDGSSDCGLFAVAMAFDLCNGIDPFLKNYDQSKMREHLRLCFEKKNVVSFPVISKSCQRKQRIVAKMTTEIFCTCRLPEEEPMACCDSCGTWYHQGCIHIPYKVFIDEDMPWICEICETQEEHKREGGDVQSSVSPSPSAADKRGPTKHVRSGVQGIEKDRSSVASSNGDSPPCLTVRTLHTRKKIGLSPHTKPGAVSDKDSSSASNYDGSFPCLTGHMIHTRKKTGLVPVSAVQKTKGDFVHYKLRTRKKTGHTKPGAVSDKDHSNDGGSLPCVTGHVIHTRKKTGPVTHRSHPVSAVQRREGDLVHNTRKKTGLSKAGAISHSSASNADGSITGQRIRTRKATGPPPHTKPGTVIDKLQSSASSDCATGCMIHTRKKKGHTKPGAVSDKDHSNDDGSLPCVTGHVIHTRKKTGPVTHRSHSVSAVQRREGDLVHNTRKKTGLTPHTKSRGATDNDPSCDLPCTTGHMLRKQTGLPTHRRPKDVSVHGTGDSDSSPPHNLRTRKKTGKT